MLEFKNEPDLPGLYVVYTNAGYNLPYAKRILVMWCDGTWTYPGSDQRFRDHVYECLGPLPAMKLED